MLMKLLKYDLKNIFKLLGVFYSLSLFFGILTRIFLNIENSAIMNLIGHICSGTAISMMFSILINNLMRLWVRFKQNLYGDESYLTHTLPVRKKTLYLSKILSALITMFVSTLVIALTLFIAYYSKENIEVIKTILLPIANAYDSTILSIISAILFVLFLEIMNILQSGFTGIILGHKMNSNKLGYSILFGFLVYMLTQTLVLSLVFITGLFNQDIMNLFQTTNIISVDAIKTVIYLSTIIYTMIIIINYYINQILFKEGVNVE